VSHQQPDHHRHYWVKAYYGPGGRAGTRKNPNRGRPGEREGDLAIATVHPSESSRDVELKVLAERPDIGDVLHGYNPDL
jgi:hypothetical protein